MNRIVIEKANDCATCKQYEPSINRPSWGRCNYWDSIAHDRFICSNYDLNVSAIPTEKLRLRSICKAPDYS